MFDGRDGALSGTAFDEDEQRRAVDIASRTWGVRMIADKAGVRAVIEPYTWQATLEEGRLRIKGFAQSEADQQTILGLVGASFPSASIDDRMEVGRGRVDRAPAVQGAGA